MNQVEKFSIGGYVFSLEGNAGRAVKDYLDQLESFYSGKESGAEVMEGIEERIAELFLEKVGDGGVVTLPMVNGVITVMGRPEAIEEESSEASPGSGRTSAGAGTDAGKAKIRRRLYRDPANGKLAGVCSGLASYFDVYVGIFRMAFVVLSVLGVICPDFRPLSCFLFPLIYIILWGCVPAVKSVRQRDELRGESGTVDAISAKIRNTPRTASGELCSKTWKGICRVFSFIFGIGFLLAGIAGLAGMCSFIWGGKILGSGFFYYRFIEHVAVSAPELMSFISAPLVIIAAILVIVIPMFMLIYGGVMLVFGLKSPKWHPGLVMFIVWLGILVALSVSIIVALSARSAIFI